MMIFAKNFLFKFKLQIIYFLVRAFSLLFLFDLAPDISNQLNVAYAMKTDGIYALRTFDFESQSIKFSEYYSHPPLLSIIIFIIDVAVNNIVYSVFIFGLVIAVIESIIVVRIIYKYSSFRRSFEFQVLLSALFIGHLDRGTFSDYLSIVVAMYLVLQMLKILNNEPLNVYFIAFLLILVPLIKYSLFPIVGSFVLINFIISFRAQELFKYKNILIFSAFIFSAFILIYFKNQGVANISNSNNRLFIDLYNILKIDHFWMHFGLETDRVYKYMMWNFEQLFGFRIWFWHFGQLFGIMVLILVMYYSRQFFLKNSILVYITLISSVAQVLFLFYLQITTPPQEGVMYGVDDKNWVFLEEARYYNYLTLLWFFILLFGLVKLKSKIFLILLVLILFFSFTRTLNARTNGFHDFRFITLSAQFEKVELMNKSNNTEVFFEDITRKSYDKNLLRIFGYSKQKIKN
jgi:hypothetical protein